MAQPDQLLALSFGASAAAYAEHRPDYSQAAVRWALELAPGARVLDLGAGTGKLTTVLLNAGVDVTAVEPDPEMLAELGRRLPDVRALQGSAEAVPVADASVDAILAGHSLHWFDMSVAGPELARVLVPDGVLAGLWNVFDDRVHWVAELGQISGPAVIGARDTLSQWREQTAHLHLPDPGQTVHFGEPEQAEFQHGQLRTLDTLVGTLATKAGMLVMSDPGRAAALSPIRAFLAATPETAQGQFVLPMLTGVLRTRRV
jgi:SAM-dependent methyltransferase